MESNISESPIPITLSDNVNQFLLVTTGPGALEVGESQQPLQFSTAQIIDLKGHCSFCLDTASIDDILNLNWNIVSMKEIWSYIQPLWSSKHDMSGTEHIFILGQNSEGNDVISRFPPMCTPCRKEVERIVTFHEEIVKLKTQLQMLEKDVECISNAIRKKMKDDDQVSPPYSAKLKGLFQLLNGANEFVVNSENTKAFLGRLNEGFYVNLSTTKDGKTKRKRRSLRSLADSSKQPNLRSSSYVIIKKLKSNDKLESERDSCSEESEFEVALENVSAPEGKLVLLVEDATGPCAKKAVKTSVCDPNNRGKACEVCGKEILVKNMLNHLHSHLGEYVFKCPNPKCNHAYLSPWSQKYYNHLKKAKECTLAAVGGSNVSVRKLKKICETCGEECDILHRFGKHLKRHESPQEVNYSCPINGCNKGFTVRQSVEFHLYMDHDNIKNAKNAKMQLRTCHVCQESISSNEFGNHLIQAHNLKETLSCKICMEIFGTREDLIDHLVTHAKQGIRCDICGEKSGPFFKGHDLREHYFLEHQTGKKLLCDEETCGYTCFSEVNLRSHKWRHHEGKEKKPYKCTICDPCREYSCKSSLSTHNIKFHGAKLLSCGFCDLKFTSADKLWKHERQHRGIQSKSYMCKICDKMFTSKTCLNVHVLSHSSERKFKCNYCEKSFKQDTGRKHHEKAEHFGVTFVCETCGKSFKDRAVLRNHHRIHTGERPYHCDHCTLSFRQKSTWRTHVKSHETKGDQFDTSKGNFERGKDDDLNSSGPKLELV